MSDHLVSEAFYLEDPDSLQIKVCVDRDPKEWLWDSDETAVSTQTLNLRELLHQPHRPWAGVQLGSTLGHIHLYIGDVAREEQLYRHGLGMNVRSRGFPGALFLTAGKYHHHIGLNTWAWSARGSGLKLRRLLYQARPCQRPVCRTARCAFGDVAAVALAIRSVNRLITAN